MTVSKAVELLMKFVDSHEHLPTESKEDLKIVGYEFEKFLSTKHKNLQDASYKLEIAICKGFVSFNDEAETLSEYVELSTEFADYHLGKEKAWIKFIYATIGSVLTVVGGIIGALITAFC